jgi:hypothetical protein
MKTLNINGILDQMATLHKSDFVQQNAVNHKLTNPPLAIVKQKYHLTG